MKALLLRSALDHCCLLILLVVSSWFVPNLALAEDEVAVASSAAEEVVVLGQLSKDHDGLAAVNETVLYNDAITEHLPDGVVQTPTQGTDASRHTAEPRQSTATAVAANKLILNQPVIDEANILSQTEYQQLSQQLRYLYNSGLAQAALVIVPTTNGIPIFDYALQVAERWQLGRADTDDGLLILVAVNDRNLYILTGYGLEGVIPDAIAKRIIREDITPYFKQGDYAAGLSAGIDRMTQRLSSDPEALARADARAAESQQGDPVSPLSLFIIALVGGMFITSIFGRVLGSVLVSGGFFAAGLVLGFGFLVSLIMSVFLWIFLLARGSGGFIPTGGGGGFGGGSSGGGFGGGGFGTGGYGGGGGGFGGGGAGGSW